MICINIEIKAMYEILSWKPKGSANVEYCKSYGVEKILWGSSISSSKLCEFEQVSYPLSITAASLAIQGW
jgi:hypothetical protein